MPVPKDRLDAAFFDILERLILGKMKMFVGAVQAAGKKGTRGRIKSTRGFWKGTLGVAMECGMGRNTGDQMRSVFEICRKVAGG